MLVNRAPGVAFAAVLTAILLYVAGKGLTSQGLAGVFPALVGCIGGLAALVNLVQAIRGVEEGSETAEAKTPSTPPADVRWLAGLSLGVPTVYAVMLWLLGFWVASAAVLLALPWILGYRRVLVVALVALGTLAAIHLVFVEVFEMRLPQGLVAERLLEAE